VVYQSNPFKLIGPSYRGFAVTWLRFLQLLLVVLAAGAAAIIVAVVLGFLNVIAGIVAAVAVLLGAMAYLSPAFYLLMIATARNKSVELRPLHTTGWLLAWRLLWTQFLAGILTLLGFVLLVVPGIFCLAWFAVVPYVVVEENLSGLAALRRSKELGGSRLRDMWGTVGLPSAVSIFDLIPFLGSIAGLGLTVIMLPMTALRYLQLVELDKHDRLEKAPVSPWNYAAIALAILGISVSGWEAASQPSSPAPSPTPAGQHST
jgi:hypothetical protein